MWQAIKTFFSVPLAKVGALTAIKVWQVALAATVVAAGAVGTYTYLHVTTPQHTTPQRVIVFIGGLNTSMTNCHEDTFDDDTHSQILASLLSRAAGIANPYVKGCNGLDPNQNYFSALASMMHFSYTGGAMDPHGFWKPNGYQPCNSVNSDTLAQDVQTFDAMLDAYRQVFPNARFTIVGHSLGGLVGLQGAYDYVVNKGNADIDKVITIDSPLKGVQAGSSTGSVLAQLEAQTCAAGGHSGSVVTTDLMALGTASIHATHADLQCDNWHDPRQAQLSWCKGQQLAQRGVGVVTLGNDQDSLFCGGLAQTSAGLDFRCFTQELGTAHLVLSKIYDLAPLPSEGFAIGGLIDTAFGSGHFTLISTPARELEIIRYILAPVVTIHQPTLHHASLVSTTGTVLPFSVAVRCLWGTASHASAQILLADGSRWFVGTATPTDRSDTLAINGTAALPASLKNASATFDVEAGGDSCHYPAGPDPQLKAQILPQNTDYFGGRAVGNPITLTTGPQSTPPYDPSPLPSPTNPTNAATLLSSSSTLTVSAGEAFTLYFDYENSGNATWTDASHYQLLCPTQQPGNDCMGGQEQGFTDVQIPPGYQVTFYLTLTAPTVPGTYQTNWQIAQNGTPLVRGQSSVKLNVTAAPMAYISVANKLYAVNMLTGKPSWQFHLPGDYTTFFGSLLSAQGLLYFSSKNTVYAIDSTSGQQLWTFQAMRNSGGAVSSLEITGATLYVFTSDGSIDALSASDGRPQWHYQYSSGSSSAFFSDALVDSGILFYASSDGSVLALNASSGSLLWNLQTNNMSNFLTISGGILCVSPSTISDGGTVYVLRAGSGAELWHDVENLGNDPTPVVGNGTVYIGTVDSIKGFNAQSGSLLWQQPILIVDGLAFQQGMLYVTASDGYLHAFDATTGVPRWKFNVELLAGSPIILQGMLYVSSGFDGALGKVFVLNATTGSPSWVYQAKDYGNPGGTTPSIVAIGAGAVFIDDGHFVHALNATNGKPLWDFDTGGPSVGGVATVVVSSNNS